MISDGVDYYDARFDPQDPYMEAAISDSVRNGLVVYSIYWQNQGRFDRSRYANASGQNLLLQVTQATGGNSYWEGIGNPVSFRPFLQGPRPAPRRTSTKSALRLPSKGKPQVENMKLKANGISGKIDAPQQVYVAPAGL